MALCINVMAYNHTEYCRQWRKKNKAKVIAAARKWENSHREQHLKQKRNWYRKNRSKINLQSRPYHRQYNKQKYATDPIFKMKALLRRRLNNALSGAFKSGSAVRDLGCSIPDFRKHIESQFSSGMTWDNQGTEWHLDHLIPLSKFDLTKREQLLIACHYTNYQPLWKKDNMAKSDLHVLDFREGVF